MLDIVLEFVYDNCSSYEKRYLELERNATWYMLCVMFYPAFTSA